MKEMNNIYYEKIKKCYEQDLLILKEKMNNSNIESERIKYQHKIELIESILNSMKG